MLHGSKEYAYAKRRRFTYNCGEFDRFVGYYLIEMADFLLASRRSDNLRLCYRNCSLTCNHRSNRPLVMENMMQYVQCYLRPYRITALFFPPPSTPSHLYLHTLQIAIPLYCRENQFHLLLTGPSCERFSENAWIFSILIYYPIEWEWTKPCLPMSRIVRSMLKFFKDFDQNVFLVIYFKREGGFQELDKFHKRE